MTESRRYYLTTAIDYPNSRPHIGTAFEKLGATFGVTAVLADSALLGNEATGGAGAAGGNGGNGLGGGIYNDGHSPFGTPNLSLRECLVAFNQADGGAAGAGGSVGLGQGGGIYNLGTLNIDPANRHSA
jgi:hypothetical protein